jgi:hypothetical protein
MTDRDQNSVLDASQTDLPSVAVADGFMAGSEGEDIVDHPPEIAVSPVIEELSAGDSQRQRSLGGVATLRSCGFGLVPGARQVCPPHGPFKSNGGCMLFEIHYYDPV